MSSMTAEDFPMWLRGVLDSVGEGEAIPADKAGLIYAKLSEVIGRQVADRFESANSVTSRMKERELEMQKRQFDMELQRLRMESTRRWTAPVPATATYGGT